MPVLTHETIWTLAEFQEYGRTVLAKAKHHVKPLMEIIAPCMGALMLRLDPGTGIEVRRGADGFLTPLLHVKIKRKEYVLTHDHKDIVIRLGSQVGPIKARISETATVRQINAAFEAL